MDEEPATTRLWTPIDDGHDTCVLLITWENGEVTIEPISNIRVGPTSELRHEPTQ